jgi:hypothetical protein
VSLRHRFWRKQLLMVDVALHGDFYIGLWKMTQEQ